MTSNDDEQSALNRHKTDISMYRTNHQVKRRDTLGCVGSFSGMSADLRNIATPIDKLASVISHDFLMADDFLRLRRPSNNFQHRSTVVTQKY